MKDKILEILNKHAEQLSESGYSCEVVIDEDFEKAADEIKHMAYDYALRNPPSPEVLSLISAMKSIKDK